MHHRSLSPSRYNITSPFKQTNIPTYEENTPAHMWKERIHHEQSKASRPVIAARNFLSHPIGTAAAPNRAAYQNSNGVETQQTQQQQSQFQQPQQQQQQQRGLERSTNTQSSANIRELARAEEKQRQIEEQNRQLEQYKREQAELQMRQNRQQTYERAFAYQSPQRVSSQSYQSPSRIGGGRVVPGQLAPLQPNTNNANPITPMTYNSNDNGNMSGQRTPQQQQQYQQQPSQQSTPQRTMNHSASEPMFAPGSGQRRSNSQADSLTIPTPIQPASNPPPKSPVGGGILPSLTRGSPSAAGATPSRLVTNNSSGVAGIFEDQSDSAVKERQQQALQRAERAAAQEALEAEQRAQADADAQQQAEADAAEEEERIRLEQEAAERADADAFAEYQQRQPPLPDSTPDLEYERYLEHTRLQSLERARLAQINSGEYGIGFTPPLQPFAHQSPIQLTPAQLHQQSRISALDRQKQVSSQLQKQAHLLPVAGSPSHLRRPDSLGSMVAPLPKSKNVSTEDILTHPGQTSEGAWYASLAHASFDIKSPNYFGPTEPTEETFQSETENSANYRPPNQQQVKWQPPQNEQDRQRYQNGMRQQNTYYPTHHSQQQYQQTYQQQQQSFSPTKFPALHSPQRG